MCGFAALTIIIPSPGEYLASLVDCEGMGRSVLDIKNGCVLREAVSAYFVPLCTPAFGIDITNVCNHMLIEHPCKELDLL